MSKRVVVTGGADFIGSHGVRFFLMAADLLFEGRVRGLEPDSVAAEESVRLRDLAGVYGEVTGEKLDAPAPGVENCVHGRGHPTALPLVTICIPVYNCRKYIARAIDSALAQTLSDFELLILDNASTDGTLDVVARYTDVRIRLVRNPINIGLEANWNKAVTEAKGKYIKLLPADDFLYPTCIERQIDVFERPENGSLVLVSCARDIVDPAGNKLVTRRFPGGEHKIAGRDAIRKVVRSGTNLLGEPGAVLFKRSILEKTGVFDGTLSYVIDVHLWLRMLLHGDLYILPDAYCAFRLSSGSTSLELATLQSRHFIAFINSLAANPDFGIYWIDRCMGTFVSQLLGLARKAFYLLIVDSGQSE
jgi:glycosyltransferase involved in cell wall biosynthesis